MKTKFMAAVAQLLEAEQQLKAGLLNSVQYNQVREACLGSALTMLATELGITLRQPLRINRNGEYMVVAERSAPISDFRDECKECGQFGEAFAELLTRHGSRNGVYLGATLPENGWCYVDHSEVERMVREQYGLELAKPRAIFMEEVNAGRATLDKIDDWVDRWHTDATITLPLREYLGLTPEQYESWVVAPGIVPLSTRIAAASLN